MDFRLSITIFLIILLITAFTPVVNTQIPYPSLNFPGLYDPLGFSYQPPTFSYTNYTPSYRNYNINPITNYNINPIWHSLTSSFINTTGRHSVPFSQTGLTNYPFQSISKLSLMASSPSFQSLSFSYQNSFNPFNYQPSFVQDWGSRNFNMPPVLPYIQAMGNMTYVSPGSNYPYVYYPGSGYGKMISAHVTTNLSQQKSEVIGTIGIITDIHYTDKDSTDRRLRYLLSGPRFYNEAADDLADFVNTMNSMGVDAAIELGDFIDIHSGNSLEEGNTNTHDDGAHGEVILFEAESIYSKLNMPHYHVIGNWDMCDYDFATADEWFRYVVNGTPDTIDSLGGKLYTDAIGNPVSRYYSFKFGRVLGISLDSSGSGPLEDNYLINFSGINGTGYVPQKQLDWLEGVLADNRSGENLPVMVFIHTFLYPVFTGNNYYMCRNHSDVRKILEADDNVIAVFNGHHHPGAQGWWEDTNNDPDSSVYHTATGVFGKKRNGIRYYNLRGSIIGWGSDSAGPTEEPSNAYYVLTVKKGESISIEVEIFQTN